MLTSEGQATVEDLRRVHDATDRIRQQLRQTIVGQTGVVDDLLTALLAGGHCLLVGVPGLAKTLMVRSLSETLGRSLRMSFSPTRSTGRLRKLRLRSSRRCRSIR